MKLVREYLYERFSDESDPIQDMGIGIGFGFTYDLEGLEHNDGKHNLYVNQAFVNKYCRILSAKLAVLEKPFVARYKIRGLNAACTFSFRSTTVVKGNQMKILYYTVGSSGSYGFNSGEQSKKFYMRQPTIKKVLEELYNHMLTLK